MKRLSSCLTFLVVSTIVVWAILQIEPGLEIHLHSEKVDRLSNRLHGDRKQWEEQLGNLSFAERFVFQAIHQDMRCDSCANFRWSVNLDLENRLQLILRRQSK